MSRRALVKPDLGTSILAICSMLALSAAFAAEFPTGIYEVKEAPYTLSFDDAGQFHVNTGDALKVTGSYSVKAGQLRFTDQTGPWACSRAGEQSGTYAWKYENAVLTFSKVEDKCEDRVRSLVNLAWKRKQ
jgi:hypothetical protein